MLPVDFIAGGAMILPLLSRPPMVGAGATMLPLRVRAVTGAP